MDQTAKNSYLGIWFSLDESLYLVTSLHLDCECDWGKRRILLKKVICAAKDSSTISWAEELNFVVKEWLRFSFLILCHQSCNDSNAVQLGNHFAPGLPQCVCRQQCLVTVSNQVWSFSVEALKLKMYMHASTLKMITCKLSLSFLLSVMGFEFNW